MAPLLLVFMSSQNMAALPLLHIILVSENDAGITSNQNMASLPLFYVISNSEHVSSFFSLYHFESGHDTCHVNSISEHLFLFF